MGKLEAIVAEIDAALSSMHESWFLRTCTSVCGRGPAINQGILEAKGDVLLMLHADTLLPAAWDEEVFSELINPAVLCSAFRFAYARDSLDGATRPLLPAGLGLLEWVLGLLVCWEEA